MIGFFVVVDFLLSFLSHKVAWSTPDQGVIALLCFWLCNTVATANLHCFTNMSLLLWLNIAICCSEFSQGHVVLSHHSIYHLPESSNKPYFSPKRSWGPSSEEE